MGRFAFVPTDDRRPLAEILDERMAQRQGISVYELRAQRAAAELAFALHHFHTARKADLS